MEMKKCKVCSVGKASVLFHKSTTHKDGRRNECGYCQSVLNWFRRGKRKAFRLVKWTFKGAKLTAIVCSSCEARQSLDSYGKRSDSGSGIHLRCLKCISDSRDKEAKRLSDLQYYVNNAEEIKHKVKTYRKANPHKIAALSAYNRAVRKRQTPDWLTEEHKAQIEFIYLQRQEVTATTGVEHHVDHILPIKGDLVSGLHVPWNLRVIPAEDNIRKSNRLEDIE